VSNTEEIDLPGPNTAIQPEEMRMLQRVYKSPLHEELLDRTQKNERDFSRVIIDFFQRGIRDDERLFADSLAVARSLLEGGTGQASGASTGN